MKVWKRAAVLFSIIPIMHAQAVDLGPSAEPSCAQVICLSPETGTAAPEECFPVRQTYFSIRIYDHQSYDAPATAEARKRFLQTCSTARPGDIAVITSKYGMLYDDPRSY